MFVEIISHTENPESLIAKSAKLCYSNKQISEVYNDIGEYETNIGFVDMLSNLGHHSPMEHITFTFAVGGVSRALLAQLTRHRIASYSVKSQRYVNEKQFNYYTPPSISNNSNALETYNNLMCDIAEKYNELHNILKQSHIDSGISVKDSEKLANEDARYILPNSCETQLIVTMNVRSLINFFEHRCCNRAQHEIRELAYNMLMLCRDVLPIVFNKVAPKCCFGVCPEGKMTCGKNKKVKELYIID